MHVNRRDFLLTSGALAVTVGAGMKAAEGRVRVHNWDKYDFGSGPPVTDRLNQGPFPQYPPDASIPSDDVVMSTMPSPDVVPNYGEGLIIYIAADMGKAEIKSDSIPRAIEDLAQLPLGQKLYIRPTWREIQPRPGRLDFPDYWKQTFELARGLNKRVGFRIQMSAPDYPEPALPDFVLEKVPMVKLAGEWKRDPKRFAAKENNLQPRYDHPYFQSAFKDLVGLLAAEFNQSPLIEFIDTFMYGLWGEGHTWPFTSTPFADYQAAERTWMQMLEVQLEAFRNIPLLTNTQPDYSNVGNSAMLDRSVRTNNWIRSDTIFIENEQIEALSNRPPWIAAAIEQGMPDGLKPLRTHEGVSEVDDIISHVMDVGANYWSLWNFHSINAQHILKYYQESPQWFDAINRKIGYRVRPSFIWSYQDDGYLGLIIGFANDGIAGVPGVLRVTVHASDGSALATGCLDPGYPLPGKIRQAQFILPKGTKWQGLKLKAELEVKGIRYPVTWACRQKTEPDGALILRANGRHAS
jgi:hypothetical protein